jgi:hypothetical protein
LKFPPHGFPLYYDTLKIQTVEGQMVEKKIGKFWLAYGRIHGFAIGISFCSKNLDINLGFWFIALEKQWSANG